MSTREELKAAAYELGKMLAGVGDFYDVAEELAKGYAAGVAGSETSRHGIRSQIGALNELQSVANSVIEWRVDDARGMYLTWEEIGEALDTSKQAAQQKYGKRK